MPLASANEIAVTYDDQGAGDIPLVLVHGHPFDRTMWAPQPAEFAAGRRLIALDLRGYGDSEVVQGSPRWKLRP